MGKVIKDIVENTFTKKNTNTYELSILVGMGSFDYVVLDSQQHLQALKSYTLNNFSDSSELEQLLNLDPIIKYRYGNTRIAWAGGKNTLIPDRLFKADEKKSYLQQTVEVAKAERVLSDDIPHAGIHNIYSVPSNVSLYLDQQFPSHQLSHLSTVLIEAQRKISIQYEGKRLYVHLVDSRAYISVFHHTNLLFFNSFEYKSAKDFIYYLLLIFDQLNLPQETTPVALSGQLVEDAEIYRLLKRYLPQFHFLEPPAFIHYGAKMEEHSKYMYFGVLCLSITA